MAIFHLVSVILIVPSHSSISNAPANHSARYMALMTLFGERPAVRRAFLDNVPKKMTEREFWTRFLRSEYFKAARAGAPPQGEEEAADLALFARRPARGGKGMRPSE